MTDTTQPTPNLLDDEKVALAEFIDIRKAVVDLAARVEHSVGRPSAGEIVAALQSIDARLAVYLPPELGDEPAGIDRTAVPPVEPRGSALKSPAVQGAGALPPAGDPVLPSAPEDTADGADVPIAGTPDDEQSGEAPA